MSERRVRCGDREFVFAVKRSRRRRTVALRIEPSGALTVFAPHYVWGPFIDGFVRKQQHWILSKLAFFKDRPVPQPVTPEERESLRTLTAARLPPFVESAVSRLGVQPRGYKVANQNSRWGSCSARGALRFSWRLGGLADSLMEYVVVHEVAHLREMNHSKRFWALVESVLPDFKARRKALRQSDTRARN
jgi:predicted metal-dependent hydrolase